MADISNVDIDEIKDLYDNLESLSCKLSVPSLSNMSLIWSSPHYD